MRHSAWNYFAKSINQCKNSLENLIKNQAFMQTMFSSQFETEELKFLEKIYDSETINKIVWEPIESMPESNNIHQLYHLARFIEYAGKRAFTNITEFGGGYGSLCVRINRLLKPQGYNIIDLPEISEIQEKYLQVNNIKANLVNSLDGLESGKTFIALWSLSETPEELRREYLEKLDYENYFFAFGDDFFDLKNHKFFEDFKEKRKNISWYLETIPFMEKQYYLMGKL